MNENGISTVHTPGKILEPKRLKQEGCHVLEKGNYIMVRTAIGASGSFMLSISTFPG
jgi:hypothetical protein